MRVNHRRLVPLLVLLAVGSLVFIVDEDDQSYYDYDHLVRELSTSVTSLTEEQIKLQDSLVCGAIRNENEAEHEDNNKNINELSNDKPSKATTIFMGTEPSKPYEGCFVSAIFGLSSSLTDRPGSSFLLPVDPC